MKKHFLATIVFLSMTGIINSSCNKTSGTTDLGTPVTDISIIAPMNYSPANFSVKVGTIVKWTNNDPGSEHSVTSTVSGTPTPLNSGLINSGATFSFTTTTTGSFPFHCTVHGLAMSGVMTVTP